MVGFKGSWKTRLSTDRTPRPILGGGQSLGKEDDDGASANIRKGFSSLLLDARGI